MTERYSKNHRILTLYQQLLDGRTVQKEDAALALGVDQRSIQRDIDDIRAFLSEQAQNGDRRQVVYDRWRKGFVLAGAASPLMTNGEILAVSKILLESRAFPKEELWPILDKLISGCVPQRNMKLVSDLLANEKFHYVELTKPARVQDKLWEAGSAVQQRRMLKIAYLRQDAESPADAVDRLVEPVAILFSEYYFYLNAYIVEEREGKYVRKYDYPAIFRLDRIAAYEQLEQTFSLPYGSRFQEGEFRKRVQFMYPGRLQSIRFRYTGASVDAVLDRLPTARILTREETGYMVEAEVYGNGILMWLLSQGKRVEVLAPESLRTQLRETLLEMLDRYSENR